MVVSTSQMPGFQGCLGFKLRRCPRWDTSLGRFNSAQFNSTIHFASVEYNRFAEKMYFEDLKYVRWLNGNIIIFS